MTRDVTLLGGHWPQWYGNLGMQFIYVRIRYGDCSIGVGGSHQDAMNKSELVRSDPDMVGVLDIKDAIRELKKQGYRVRSIIVPEHVEEIEE